MIQVNPYEIIHIAAHFGIATTAVLERFVQPDKPWLKRGMDGACVFMDDAGCGIHPHRPLVCRVYPLGAQYDEQHAQYFFRMRLPDGSEGVFGEDGRVRDYLAAQGCPPYFDFARRSNGLRQRLLAHVEAGGVCRAPQGFGDDPMDWLDADKVCALAGVDVAGLDEAGRFERYEAVVASWLGN